MGRTQGQRQNPEHNRHHSRNVGHESTQAIPSIAQGGAPLIETRNGALRPPIMAGKRIARAYDTAHFDISYGGVYTIQPGYLPAGGVYLFRVVFRGYQSIHAPKRNRLMGELDALDTLSFVEDIYGYGCRKTAYLTCEMFSRVFYVLQIMCTNGRGGFKYSEKSELSFELATGYGPASRHDSDQIDWYGDTEIGRLIGPAPVRLIREDDFLDFIVACEIEYKLSHPEYIK